MVVSQRAVNSFLYLQEVTERVKRLLLTVVDSVDVDCILRTIITGKAKASNQHVELIGIGPEGKRRRCAN